MSTCQTGPSLKSRTRAYGTKIEPALASAIRLKSSGDKIALQMLMSSHPRRLAQPMLQTRTGFSLWLAALMVSWFPNQRLETTKPLMDICVVRVWEKVALSKIISRSERCKILLRYGVDSYWQHFIGYSSTCPYLLFTDKALATTLGSNKSRNTIKPSRR